MLADEKPEEKSIFRNPFVYTTTLIAVAVVYVGFVFFSRWEENRTIEERAKAKEREEAARAVEMMGPPRRHPQAAVIPVGRHRAAGRPVRRCPRAH